MPSILEKNTSYSFFGIDEETSMPPGVHDFDKISARLNNFSIFKANACEINWLDDGDYGVDRFEIIEFHNEKKEQVIHPGYVDAMQKGLEPPEEQDNVNNPKHYQLLPGVEVINVREAILSKIPEGVPYCQIDTWSRASEYLLRMWGKNGLEDAKKARWYLDRLIKQMEGEQ